MEFSKEQVLTPLEVGARPVPERAANEKAFYTAATLQTDEQDPISVYNTVKTELMSEGISKAYDLAKNKWIQEQDEFGKEYFAELISNPNVSSEEKRNALSLYASSGYISQDIRDKYVEALATSASGDRNVDTRAVEELLKSFSIKEEETKQTRAQELIELGTNEDKDIGAKGWVLGTLDVGLDIIKSVPASIWGALYAIKERDAITFQEVTSEVLNNWVVQRKDESINKAKEKIYEKLEYLAIPFNEAASLTLSRTGNEQAAIGAGLVAETLLGGAVIKAFKKGKGNTKNWLNKPKANTPLDTTIKANPKRGGDLATAAILDDTGQMAGALGETQGSIISNLVLPKPKNLDILDHLPSIGSQIVRELSELDSKVRKALEDSRWDPSIHNESLRRADYDLMKSLTREVDSPTYMSALSTLDPDMSGKYIGKAVYGRDNNHFFHSRNEAIKAYESILENYKGVPEDFNAQVSIVNRLTGEKFTPETLMSDPRWAPQKTPTLWATRAKETINELKEVIRRNPELQEVFKQDPIQAFTRATNEAFDTLSKNAQRLLLSGKLKDPESGKSLQVTKRNTGEGFTYDISPAFMKALKDLTSETHEVTPPLSAKQFSVEVNWERTYSDLDVLIFGAKAVESKLVFGIDVSSIARGPMSQWWFGGQGIFPKWFEQAGNRAAPRAAKQASTILKEIQKKIANTKFPKELNLLVNEAEANMKEFYSFQEIANRFPYLKTDQVANVYEAHHWWRAVTHFNHQLINLTYRNRLVTEKFDSGLIINGEYKGAVKKDVTFNPGEGLPAQVWDFDLDVPVEFKLNLVDENGTKVAYDLGGKKIVALKKPYTDTDGNIFTYGLVGGSKSRLDILPDQVVPRIPGYSPIKTKASWYLDIVPLQVVVNGRTINDPLIVRNYKRTVAAGETKKDIQALKEEFERKYPDSIVSERLDRSVSFNRIETDQEAHQALLRNAMERGERLESLNGPAPIEDRLVSLVESVRTLTRNQSMAAYEVATESAFVKEFKDFLPNGEFPNRVSDIKLPVDPTEAMIKEYDNAVTIFNQYSKIKSFGTWGDAKWEGALNGIANILENIPQFNKLAPKARELGTQGNILVNSPRALGSLLYITYNSFRQWLVQPAQLFELWSINPATAPKRLAELSAYRMAISAEAGILEGSKLDWYNAALKLSPGTSPDEFKRTVEAIKTSGLLESIDLNMLVHNMVKDLNRPLVEGPIESIYNSIAQVPKGMTVGARAIGFDFAELNNRMGIWLFMRDKWRDLNPGKKWDSPEAIAEISNMEYRYAGSMTRAGSYPYQSGVLSVFMQFAAITQKMTMNLLQQNGLLSPAEKARLTAARMALWGTKFGLPGGALIHYYLEKSEDPEVIEASEILKRGLADRSFNMLMDALAGSEGSDLNLARGMSPYGDSSSGIPYIDTVIEFGKLFDGSNATNPRLPAIGAIDSVSTAFGNMRSWFVSKDITNENEWKRSFDEAMKVASGMNNFMQMQLMYSTKSIITKNGNKLELDFTAGEAFGRLFGARTWREAALWEGISASIDRKERNEKVATEIHRWLVNQMNTMGTDDPVKRFEILTSFMTFLHDEKNFVEQDIQEVYELLLEKDKRSSKNVESGLVEYYLKHYRTKQDAEMKVIANSLRALNKPNINEMLDIIEGKGNP